MWNGPIPSLSMGSGKMNEKLKDPSDYRGNYIEF